MNVIVHGTVYQWQRRGGISRVYNELLPRVCELDPSICFHVVTEGPTLQKPPTHPRITHTNLSQIGGIVLPERIIRPLVTLSRRRAFQYTARWRGANGSIWQATHYTRLEGFRGPSVVIVYDMCQELYPDLFCSRGDELIRERKRACVESADTVVCISETTRRDVRRLYGLEAARIVTIPLAPADVFRRPTPLLGRPKDVLPQPYFLYVGTRAHYKNFRALAEAFSTRRYSQTASLIVVGDVPWTAEENEMLVRMGISERVSLLRDLTDDELSRLYSGAIALVYPSLYEGFGIPILEACASGCPVVASRIPSTVEIAGDVPIYFDPHSISGLASALDQAVEEAANSGRIQKGFDLARQYTWDESARRWLGVYRELGR